MPVTIALAVDVVVEVIHHMSLFPVTPPPPMEAIMEAPGIGLRSGGLKGYSHSLLYLLAISL